MLFSKKQGLTSGQHFKDVMRWEDFLFLFFDVIDFDLL